MSIKAYWQDAISEQDPITASHQARVAQVSVSIGKALGLSQSDLSLLHEAASLHDLGKTQIDRTIVNKPDRLSEAEWVVMRSHVDLGVFLLSSDPALKEACEIVGAHHERWDGMGYPRRLLGTQIPRLARIIAVADAFDAMVSDRPYRGAIGAEEAAQEIQKNRGTQFDPEVVDAFVTNFRDWLNPLNRQSLPVRLQTNSYVMV